MKRKLTMVLVRPCQHLKNNPALDLGHVPVCGENLDLVHCLTRLKSISSSPLPLKVEGGIKDDHPRRSSQEGIPQRTRNGQLSHTIICKNKFFTNEREKIHLPVPIDTNKGESCFRIQIERIKATTPSKKRTIKYYECGNQDRLRNPECIWNGKKLDAADAVTPRWEIGKQVKSDGLWKECWRTKKVKTTLTLVKKAKKRNGQVSQHQQQAKLKRNEMAFAI